MPATARFDADADGNTLVEQLVPAFDGGGVWKSAWLDVTPFRRINVNVRANQPFAVDGVVLEQSILVNPAADADADYWTPSGSGVDGGTVVATHPIIGSVTNYRVALSVERNACLRARLVVKHGGVAPTAFRARVVGAGIT